MEEVVGKTDNQAFKVPDDVMKRVEELLGMDKVSDFENCALDIVTSFNASSNDEWAEPDVKIACLILEKSVSGFNAEEKEQVDQLMKKHKEQQSEADYLSRQAKEVAMDKDPYHTEHMVNASQDK